MSPGCGSCEFDHTRIRGGVRPGTLLGGFSWWLEAGDRVYFPGVVRESLVRPGSEMGSDLGPFLVASRGGLGPVDGCIPLV